MAPHENCAGWEYKSHPRYAEVGQRCGTLAQLIQTSPKSFDRFQLDTRRGHKYIFGPVAPLACPCIVGHYRGTTDCECLRMYDVRVFDDKGQIDPKVGVPPYQVSWYMDEFEKRIGATFTALKSWTSAKTKAGPPSPAAVLSRLVGILADTLESFFAIHPYANGNGHAGRILVRVLMSRFGIVPVEWPLHRSPDYDDALKAHRNGNPIPLQKFLLEAIIGSSTPKVPGTA